MFLIMKYGLNQYLTYRMHASLEFATFQCEETDRDFKSAYIISEDFVSSHFELAQIVEELKKLRPKNYYIYVNTTKSTQVSARIFNQKNHRVKYKHHALTDCYPFIAQVLKIKITPFYSIERKVTLNNFITYITNTDVLLNVIINEKTKKLIQQLFIIM